MATPEVEVETDPVQRLITAASTLLILLSVLVVGAEWAVGELNPELFLTDFSLVLLTIGVSVLFVNGVLVRLDRRTQRVRAKTPLRRIEVSADKAEAAIVQFLAEALNDEEFVHQLLGDGIHSERLSPDYFRDQILSRPANPTAVSLELYEVVQKAMERYSSRFRSDSNLTTQFLTPLLAARMDKGVERMEVGSELLSDPPEGDGSSEPSFKDVVFALSECYGALCDVRDAIGVYRASERQSFLERWPTPFDFLHDLYRGQVIRRRRRGPI